MDFSFPLKLRLRDPTRSEELVYVVNAYLGEAFESSYYTRDLYTIYLIADSHSVVSLRKTFVYYWPITNREKADLDALDEQVEGTLVIRQGGRDFALFELDEYVIQYEKGRGRSPGQLFLGSKALDQWENFDAARSAYRQSVLKIL